MVVVCTGAYLLWVNRHRCAAFVLGGLPFLIVLTAYNYHYFGHPLAFGQSVVALLPARPGNNQIDSVQNVVEQPRVCLPFFLPHMNETLRARATVGARQAADFRAARHRERGVPALPAEP